jgi:glycosyltransferase involved in cell wall biosynthesis
MSSHPIKFSVIIPSFNNAGTLARAIESVLAQSYQAHEIIVIDDGSTDDTRVVVQPFGDMVRYIHQANAGVSTTRNNGARYATGDWLTFLDADDIYMPDRLMAHAAWLERDPELDFLFADQEQRDDSDKLLHMAIAGSAFGRELVARHPGLTDIPLSRDDFRDFIADGFAEIRTLSLPRKTFLDLGGFPTDRRIGEDMYFFIRLCAASRKGGVVNRPLAVYYIYPNSALRKDVVAAQTAYVETIESLEPELRDGHPQIRRGWQAKLRQGRLSLAYMHLRAGRRGEALRAVLPLVWRQPSVASLRDVVSVVRGLR